MAKKTVNQTGKGTGSVPGGTGKKKKWGAKNVLHSPFSTAPPPALAGSAEAVCRSLKMVFPSPPLHRVRLHPERQKESVDASTSASADIDVTDAAVEIRSLGQHGVRGEETGSIVQSAASFQPKRIRSGRPSGMHFGMNEVTKGLEKGDVSMVVVARDVSPPILIAHLPVLCYLRDASLVICSGGGQDFAKILGVKRMLAFAIADPSSIQEGRGRELASKLCESLRPHAALLDFPWLAAARGKEEPPGFPEPVVAPANKLL